MEASGGNRSRRSKASTGVGMKKKPRRKKPIEGRLNLIIDPELKEWAHEYASRSHTTVSAIVIRHFLDLREEDQLPNVPQI